MFGDKTLVSLLYDLVPRAEREIELIKRVLMTDCSKLIVNIIKDQKQGKSYSSDQLVARLKDEWLNDEAIAQLLFIFGI